MLRDLSIASRWRHIVRRTVLVYFMVICAVAIPRALGEQVSTESPQATTNDEPTRAIGAQLHKLWDCYKNLDAAGHNAILTDDYTAVHPDGSIHHKPTAQQIAAAPIRGYSLTDLHAAPLAPGIALANYIAEVEAGTAASPIHLKWVVGEVWINQAGVWKCRYYQPTPLP